jgi:hypothetical protein
MIIPYRLIFIQVISILSQKTVTPLMELYEAHCSLRHSVTYRDILHCIYSPPTLRKYRLLEWEVVLV